MGMKSMGRQREMAAKPWSNKDWLHHLAERIRCLEERNAIADLQSQGYLQLSSGVPKEKLIERALRAMKLMERQAVLLRQLLDLLAMKDEL